MAKYRYVMESVDTVETSTVIESDVKLTFSQLSDEFERRRSDGELGAGKLTNSEVYCSSAKVNGREDRSGIAN